MLGKSNNDIASSEYLHKIQGVEFSPAPYFNIDEELKLHQKAGGADQKEADPLGP